MTDDNPQRKPRNLLNAEQLFDLLIFLSERRLIKRLTLDDACNLLLDFDDWLDCRSNIPTNARISN